jgi:hypothetical protein
MHPKKVSTSALVVLLIAQLGSAQPAQDSSQVWRSFAGRLEAGAFVEVRLKDRTKVKGHLIETSDERLSLKPKTRVPVPIRNFQFEDIESIERRNDGWSPAAKVITGTLATVGGLLLLAMVALATSYD